MDDEVPVVADFLTLSDDFAGQNTAPVYVVIDAPVFSEEGRALYLSAMSVLDSDESISEQTGIWEALELEATRDASLREAMDSIGNDSPDWAGLASWADANGDKVFRYLRDDNQQTVISFYAPSLDWQDTVDFLEDLDQDLSQGGDDYRVSGRGIILAQISEDVARSAVASTGIVAGMILLMLIGINVSREERPTRGALKGLVMWIPLAVVVVWVYGLMGWLGYQLNSQTVTIGALTLGLGVDYAVHFVTRLDEEVEHDPNAGISKWVSITNATTGTSHDGGPDDRWGLRGAEPQLPTATEAVRPGIRGGHPPRTRLERHTAPLPDEPLRPATQVRNRQLSQNRPLRSLNAPNTPLAGHGTDMAVQQKEDGGPEGEACGGEESGELREGAG